MNTPDKVYERIVKAAEAVRRHLDIICKIILAVISFIWMIFSCSRINVQKSGLPRWAAM